ncbi:hypothetical protein [Chryseobacterium sp. AG363]|uniref:hypothetical protein n=1 Tax=Chryseobacterium sp. AG363 TaxID=2183997 RepID=UPI000E70DACA|nr:hypothetical protein [Chryseobacterium sp. AG363]
MRYFDFNPFGIQSIKLKFNCIDCNNEVESENIYIPSPDYSADTSRESQADEDGYAVCSKCKKDYEISIYVSFSGGDGYIQELDEETPLEIIENYDYELDAILSNNHFYENFKNEINKISDLNDLNITSEEDSKKERDSFVSAYGMLLPDELIETLRKLLYTNVITCLEAYLSSAYINTVISKPQNLKKFYETFLEFQKEKVTLSKLYELKDQTEEIAKQAMHKVLYHNLDKVNAMFKDTFAIPLPDFSKLTRSIEIRHDIVHRNGFTKDNELIIITQNDITELIDITEKFVSDLDIKINKL